MRLCRRRRRKANPEDAPRVTRKQVEDYAKSINLEIYRDGKGMWYFRRDWMTQ
jgi:hypothetical protein